MVQMLASVHLKNGLYFYVPGHIPEHKDPTKVDAKLIAKHGIDIPKATRCRQRKACIASIHYLRFGRSFFLLASHGEHQFFEEEAGLIKDCRVTPIKFAGYAISVKKGHSCVRVERETFKRLKRQ
jgi:hypothetical protein